MPTYFLFCRGCRGGFIDSIDHTSIFIHVSFVLSNSVSIPFCQTWKVLKGSAFNHHCCRSVNKQHASSILDSNNDLCIHSAVAVPLLSIGSKLSSSEKWYTVTRFPPRDCTGRNANFYTVTIPMIIAAIIAICQFLIINIIICKVGHKHYLASVLYMYCWNWF